VLQEQVLEFLAAYANANRDPSLLDVYARVKDEEQVEHVLEALDEAASRATEELVAEQRLQNLKTRKRYEFLMQLETPDSVARTLARPLAIDGSLAGIERLYATYATLTPAELREAARQVLTPARRTTGVLRATSQA
jgi:predicted Zn-dependent peptidase